MKRFWFELLRAGLALLPLIEYEIALHVEIFPVLWPPLGTFDRFGSVTSAVLAMIAWVLPTMFTTRAAERQAIRRFMALTVISLIAYVVMFLACVRSVETPDNGTQYRSIGIFRTEPFRTKYAGKSDEELLHTVGLEDKGIRTAWTSGSITLARSGLFFFYFVTLASCPTVIGLHLKPLARRYTAAVPRR
jgi:hypothetical protein